MSDETKTEGTEETEPAEEKPETVTIDAESLDELKAENGELRRMVARQAALRKAGVPLYAEQLEKRLQAQHDDFPSPWEGQGPGLHLRTSCCDLKADVVYFRGTLGIMCRDCKRLFHRVRVAWADEPEEKAETSG